MKYKNFKEYMESDEYLIMVLGQQPTLVEFDDNTWFEYDAETKDTFALYARGVCQDDYAAVYLVLRGNTTSEEIAYFNEWTPNV